MQLMEFRRTAIAEAVEGYRATGFPLVGKRGDALTPAGYGDDIGLYYVVPKIARAFDLGPDQALVAFIYTVTLLGAGLGLLGCFLYFRQVVARATSILCIALLAAITLGESHHFVSGILQYAGGDIYVVCMAAVLGFVPLWAYWVRRFGSPTTQTLVALSLAAFASALVLSFLNIIRMHSGTPVLLFVAVLLLFGSKAPRRARMVALAAGAVGIIVPLILMSHAIDARDAFLAEQDLSYEPVPTKHIFWHSAYISFGYLANPYNVTYNDEVAMALVAKVDPNATFMGPRYEEILRDATFRFMADHPSFALQSFAARAGVMAFYLGLFANIGLLCAYLFPKHYAIELAFWSSILFASLAGIIGVPIGAYILSFIGMAALYALFSINEALQRGIIEKGIAGTNEAVGRLRTWIRGVRNVGSRP